ncbi:hypothetical protein VSS74_26855, partial [Conexibacter stalactiti]
PPRWRRRPRAAFPRRHLRPVSTATVAALAALAFAAVAVVTLDGGGTSSAPSPAGGGLPAGTVRGTTGTALTVPVRAADAALIEAAHVAAAADELVCASDARPTPHSSVQILLDGRMATEICAAAWRRGHVLPREREAPPSLRPCVSLDGGPIHVVPGGDGACTRAALVPAPLNAGATERQQRVGAFERALIAAIHDGRRCVGEREGRRITRALLAQHDLASWRVLTGGGIRGEGFSAARPCVSLAFDAAGRTVTLVPMTR